MKLLKPLVVCCIVLFIPTFSFAKIVFISRRDGGNNIYVMDDDGSNLQRLTFTQSPQWDVGPVWSPDGKRIAFFRNISEIPKRQHPRLFIIDRDGSNEQQITEDYAGSCTWAPDGRRIAFAGKAGIYVIDIVTREMQLLTQNQDVGGSATSPAWSPDGKYIAYRQTLPIQRSTTIYIMKADGTNEHPLVPGDEWNRYTPRWSPDSKSVLYIEALYDRVLGVLITNNVVIQERVLKSQRNLKTPGKWLLYNACWYDNGKQVLIAAEEYGAKDRQIEIYKYHLANDQITNITNDPEDDWGQDWISDNILSVLPMDKKSTQWGKLKSLLETVVP